MLPLHDRLALAQRDGYAMVETQLHAGDIVLIFTFFKMDVELEGLAAAAIYEYLLRARTEQ